MAVAQSTYSENPAIGVPGAIANEETFNSISRTVETAAGLGFGQPAARSADTSPAGDHLCRLLASGATFLGIAILNRAVPASESNPDAYPQYMAAALLTQGSIFVTAGATVAAGDDVYWNSSTGKYGTSSGGSNIAIPEARFETSGGDGDIVEVSLGNRRL
jgi:hypothetical protein